VTLGGPHHPSRRVEPGSPRPGPAAVGHDPGGRRGAERVSPRGRTIGTG